MIPSGSSHKRCLKFDVPNSMLSGLANGSEAFGPSWRRFALRGERGNQSASQTLAVFHIASNLALRGMELVPCCAGSLAIPEVI
jgi:hypothetical protein